MAGHYMGHWCPCDECNDSRVFCEYCDKVLDDDSLGQYPDLLKTSETECDSCALGDCPVCGEYAISGDLISTPKGYVCDEECLLKGFPLIYLVHATQRSAP